MRITALKTDENLEQAGAWYTYPGSPDKTKPMRLRIARIRNPAHRDGLRAEIVAAQSAHPNGDIPDLELREITIRAMAQHILLDWENIEDDDGNTITYSVANATALLKIPAFFEIVERFSMQMQNFQTQQQRAAAGN